MKRNELENNSNAVEQFKKRFKPNDLSINRVPPNTIKWFKEFASKEEFCEDYGKEHQKQILK